MASSSSATSTVASEGGAAGAEGGGAAPAPPPSLVASDLPGLSLDALGVATFRELLAHPSVAASLTQHGLAVIRGFGAAVHPRVHAASQRAPDMVAFLDALDPALARKKVRMNSFKYHRTAACMVQDRGCASETQPQTLRSAYARATPSLNPMDDESWCWDTLVRKRLPDSVLAYGSDVPLSLLGYERRGQEAAAAAPASPAAAPAAAAASSSSSSSSSAAAPAPAQPDLRGLDMTLLSASDCLYRALLVGDGLQAPGMSTCYTYFGKAYAVFAAHTEDHNLPSINQLLHGAPKVWYAVPGRHYGEAVEAMTGFAPRGELPRCAQALAHKLLLPSLSAVRDAGLPCIRMVQWPGDLVITAPGAVHWGMNCGVSACFYARQRPPIAALTPPPLCTHPLHSTHTPARAGQDNVAESTNLADASWLTSSGVFEAFLERGPCTCKDSNAWGIIPRVWLPRGFFFKRLQGPYLSAAAAAGPGSSSARKRRREPLCISTPEGGASAPAASAATAAAAAAAVPPPSARTIGQEFGVPLELFAPAPLALGEGGEEEEGAAAAAAAEQQPLCHSWYVAEVLEHRLWRGKAGRHEFRVRWVGLRANDRRHRKWHPFSTFASFDADGCLPGETTCTLVDSKIGDYMALHKIV